MTVPAVDWCGVHHPHGPHRFARAYGSAFIAIYVDCPGSTCGCGQPVAAASPHDDPRPGTPAALGGPISDEPDIPPTTGLRRSGLLAAAVPPLEEDAPK